jgi:hypothetical protein
MRSRLIIASLFAVTAAAMVVLSDTAASPKSSTPQNVNVSKRLGNESEEAIGVNPTNPNNIVIFTNIAEGVNGMFLAVSFDGGQTWSRRIVGQGNDVFGDTCCDPSLSFDEYGNLFMTYLYNTENTVPVVLSTDGGLTFNLIAKIAKPASLAGRNLGGERRGLFRYVDQPTITAAKGQVWVVFNAGGPIFATGAPVTGLGQVGAFLPGQAVPGTNNCTYGDVAIGPVGQVMQACNLTETGQGGGKVFVNVNVDPDGLGPTGNIAVVWYDSRNDLGNGDAGDTDGVLNDDAQFWGSFSIDGGLTFSPNFQISTGTSNSHDSGNHIDYGDYSGLSFHAGVAHPAWADNSNSTGDNPDGALHKLDIYTAAVPTVR